MAFIFLDRTNGLPEDERANLALRVAGYAFIVLLVSLFFGSQILNFFGVTIPALRIAGGLVAAGTGLTLLHAAPGATGPHEASSTNLATMKRMAFFPLTIPLTTGPGTIATAIAIGISRSYAMFGSSIVSLLVALAVTAAISRLQEIQCDGAPVRRGRHRRGDEIVSLLATLHRGPDHHHWYVRSRDRFWMGLRASKP